MTTTPSPQHHLSQETEPRRVQLRRTKGWRMPPNTVSVARPTRWGNPVDWRDGLVLEFSASESRLIAVEAFREMVEDKLHGGGTVDIGFVEHLGELRGRNLACWCPLVDEEGRPVPCHADVLLEIANA